MIVLDTHAWIWWMNSPGSLSRKVQARLRDEKEVGISAMSCWELAMLIAKGRLELDRDVLLWIHQSLAQPRLSLLPLGPEIAVAAARLGADFPGDPVDRIIYSTARHHGWRLVTRDGRIRQHDPELTFW
ncbi:MAG TPA: type II toxin-antitoxin system VapC family toxin [Planctomycetota bacterium]|nr:type II toxin-antitoxin system VapC family toxin [Planctomycetota bacterium]